MLEATIPSNGITIQAANVGVFENMVDCFKARDSFASAVFKMPPGGYYPPNTQAVCIRLVPTTGT